MTGWSSDPTSCCTPFSVCLFLCCKISHAKADSSRHGSVPLSRASGRGDRQPLAPGSMEHRMPKVRQCENPSWEVTTDMSHL